MKVLLIVFIACMVTIGCSEEKNPDRVNSETVEHGFGRGVSIITVDSCQYVWVARGYGAGLSHKGNCNNPIHKINHQQNY